MDSFTGRQGLRNGKAPVVVIENVIDGVLRNLRAADGSGTFFEFRGAGTKDLWVHTSDLRKAAQHAAFADGAERGQIILQ